MKYGIYDKDNILKEEFTSKDEAILGGLALYADEMMRFAEFMSVEDIKKTITNDWESLWDKLYIEDFIDIRRVH